MKFAKKGGRRTSSTVIVSLLGSMLASVGFLGELQAAAAPQEDFSGTWVHDFNAGNIGLATNHKSTDKVFKLLDGSIIPLRPDAIKLYRERVAMGETAHVFANTSSRCLPIGTPGNMMGAPYPIRFVQRPEFIAILFEEGWEFRAIYMNGKHPDNLVPSFMGHSVGHWDGKTLVIDTVGMREETTLNFTGLPHSTEMHVVERITRTGAETLLDSIEITDPPTYEKPFVLTSQFRKSHGEQIEYICEDGRIQVTPDGRQTYGNESVQPLEPPPPTK